MTLSDLKKELKKNSNLAKANFLQRYFKTEKGGYGEGDIFLGIPVPLIRKIAKGYRNVTLKQLQNLIGSKIHEYRSACLEILLLKYKNANEDNQKEIVDFYLRNTKYINNWDLVDLSAPNILGDYLLKKSRDALYLLAKSKNLWERRIAVLSTYQFIKHNKFGDALNIAEILLEDNHDLIHKSVGWMLREVGKRSPLTEERFLKKFYRCIPKTMLRYAIEKIPEKKRRLYT